MQLLWLLNRSTSSARINNFCSFVSWAILAQSLKAGEMDGTKVHGVEFQPLDFDDHTEMQTRSKGLAAK